MISSDSLLQLKRKLPFRNFEGTVVIVDPETYACVTLNEVATFIWLQIDGKTTFGEIVSRITEEFDVDEKAAAKDTQKFLKKFIEKNIILIKDHADIHC